MNRQQTNNPEAVGEIKADREQGGERKCDLFVAIEGLIVLMSDKKRRELLISAVHWYQLAKMISNQHSLVHNLGLWVEFAFPLPHFPLKCTIWPFL